ncbi:AmpD protein [Solimonas aquatica]|uniref:1,6-anhydro-N-acetylmuramyl-L-alanine amidase AmpD n=1 Tax=Solimonas aquatica TaxID=489703 RepID=A0A1H9EHN9_9GAMM|nr:AmpD protein [Solimonas aquatica]
MAQARKGSVAAVSAEGWLAGARVCVSPFCDERPDAADLSLVVIHGISLPPGQYGGPYIEQLFTGRLDPDAHPYFAGIHQLKVSAHLLIRRDGSVIQYVPFTRRAWHAGVSRWQARERCNDFSIGIELEGSDEEAYALAQYAALAAALRALLAAYPRLSRAGIVGHSDIAPGRKTDPGPYFDWARLRADLE